MFRVGAGVTVKELNDFAKKYGNFEENLFSIINITKIGYYLPVKNEEVFAQKQMNEIVNEDTLEYNHKYYYSIRNFLNNMLIVMPDSTAVKTSSDIYKSSFGLNLNE